MAAMGSYFTKLGNDFFKPCKFSNYKKKLYNFLLVKLSFEGTKMDKKKK